MMVAFRFHIAPLGNSLFLDVYVTPQFGFYVFLGATVLSLGIGHMETYYNRRLTLYSSLFYNSDSCNKKKQVNWSNYYDPQQHSDDIGSRYSLISHVFKIKKQNNEEMEVCISSAGIIVVILLVKLVAGLLSVGMTVKSFTFEFGGLAAMVLRSTDQQTAVSYSVINIGTALLGTVEFSSGLGIHLLQCVYFFYTVITPFLCLFSLCILLLCPMTLHEQIQVLAIAEVANAWSSIEVFLLSVVAALLEISTFANFMVGHKCDFINSILSQYIDQNHSQLSSDDFPHHCFSVSSSINVKKTLILLVGVILNTIWVTFVFHFAHAVIIARVHKEKDKKQKNCQNTTDSNENIASIYTQQSPEESLFIMSKYIHAPFLSWFISHKNEKYTKI
jgi:Paraquat-inducible protein A